MIGDGGLVTGGGIFGGAASLAYAVKLLVEARREDRTTRRTPVADAAAANSVLLSALQERSGEVQRLSTEVDELRDANSELYADMQRQRREHEADMQALRTQYEAELQALRSQLVDLTDRLDELQTRIRDGLPKT